MPRKKTESTFTIGQAVRHRVPNFCACIAEDESVWASGTVTALGTHGKGGKTVTVKWADGIERKFTASFVIPAVEAN